MKVEVSTGELIDKVTILSIKLEKIKDKKKLLHIIQEYELLKKSMVRSGITETSEEFIQLRNINSNLWEIEDKIRLKEKKKEFDEEFIQLARSVYFNNDERSAIKRQINLKFNSQLIEEKAYIDYKKS